MKITSSILACCAFVLTAAALAPAADPTPTTRPNHVIYGYVPTWNDKLAAPTEMNFSAYTHLSRAFLRPHADGTLLVDPQYFDAAFERAARAAGVKLLMAVGGAGRNPDPWPSLLGKPESTKTFLDTLARLYDEHGYDGLDIDCEPMPTTEAGGRDYAALVRQLRERFPTKLLVVTVSGKDYALRYLPMQQVLTNVDYVNAMFYDYNASWTGIASFASNLNRDASPAAGATFSVSDGLDIVLNKYHIPPAKLVAGVTFWGYRFRANTLGEQFSKHTPGLFDSIQYGRVLDLLGTGKYTAKHSESADADYLVRNDGGSLITYETPKTIRDKCDRAKELGLAGIMIWHAGADLTGGTTPLLDVVVQSFGMPALPLSEPALRREVERFRGKAVSPGETVDQLLASDRALRMNWGQAEDARWAKGPTKQPARE